VVEHLPSQYKTLSSTTEQQKQSLYICAHSVCKQCQHSQGALREEQQATNSTSKEWGPGRGTRGRAVERDYRTRSPAGLAVVERDGKYDRSRFSHLDSGVA
jgi:hypothetical protein